MAVSRISRSSSPEAWASINSLALSRNNLALDAMIATTTTSAAASSAQAKRGPPQRTAARPMSTASEQSASLRWSQALAMIAHNPVPRRDADFVAEQRSLDHHVDAGQPQRPGRRRHVFGRKLGDRLPAVASAERITSKATFEAAMASAGRVPVRMFVVGRPLRHAKGDQDDGQREDVAERVDGVGDQCHRAADQPAGQFGRSEREIDRQP